MGIVPLECVHSPEIQTGCVTEHQLVRSMDFCTRAESKLGSSSFRGGRVVSMYSCKPLTEERLGTGNSGSDRGLQPGKQEDDASSGYFKISSLKSMNLDRTWANNYAKERKVQNIIRKRKQSEALGWGCVAFPQDHLEAQPSALSCDFSCLFDPEQAEGARCES